MRVKSLATVCCRPLTLAFLNVVREFGKIGVVCFMRKFFLILSIVSILMIFVFAGFQLFKIRKNQELLSPRTFPGAHITGKTVPPQYDDFKEKIWVHRVNTREKLM
ncbi:MAG: hypothetical protein FWF54_03925 [Candidatus Azobacteroides sp.]|nr:hypothetical protein [Candidatus Azobacteroides sp.]